jgi:purine-cytosine permease-like protein
MPLHDVDSLAIETSTTAESLPDPTLWNGRAHDLTNTGTASAVWSSIGATPFLVVGSPVATLTVARGATIRVQSDGTRWVVIRPYGTRRLIADKGTTDASGNTTVTFTPAFSTVPVVTAALETSNTDVTDLHITALSTSSVTFQARRTPTTVVLGVTVLGTTVPLVGATVHIMATAVQQSP